MHKHPLSELEESGLAVHGLAIGAPSQNSDCFRLGIAWAKSNDNADSILQRVIEESFINGSRSPISNDLLHEIQNLII